MQQVAHGEQSVRTKHSHIFDRFRLATNFLYPLGQPLNAEEIFLRELSRHFAEEGSITAPKIDMQRGAASKKLCYIQARNLQLRLYLDHTGKVSASCRRINTGNARLEGKHLEERRVRSDMKETV